MLAQLGGGRVGVGGGAEDGEDEGDAAADGLGAVKDGGLGEPEAVCAGGGFPREDGGTVEEDLDGLAGGEGGGDAGVVVGDVDGGLGREAGRGGQGGGLVGPVDHVCCCVAEDMEV